MDLWIRSQDKESLIQVDCLCIEKNELDKGKYIYSSFDIVQGCITLGTYKTKERAIEILDEIQNLIQPKMNFIVSQHIDFDNDGEGLIGCNILKEEPKIERISDVIVYEMPKE